MARSLLLKHGMRSHAICRRRLIPILAAFGGIAACEDARDDVALRLHDPSGAVEITHLHAGRLSGVDGATVCELSDFMWEANRILPEIRRLVEATHAGATVVPYTELPDAYQADPDALAAAVRNHGCHAVIVASAG